MTTPRVRPTATATIDGDEYAVRKGSTARLDSAAVPYAEASLQFPRLADEVLAALNPRSGARVQFEHSINGVTRTFDMAVRRVGAAHRAKTTSVTLASDELLLQKYKTLTPDNGARASEASCRAVCDYVLDKIGASLEAGTDDADVTAYWSVTNLISNPVAAVDGADWFVAFNGTFVGRTLMGSPIPPVGAGHAIQWTATASGVSTLVSGTTSSYRVIPGKWYVWTFYLASGGLTDARAALQWRSRDGGGTLTTVYGSIVGSTNTSFQRLHVIAQAPDGAESVWPFIDTAGNPAGRAHYVTGAMLYEGSEVVDYFDGSTADDALYSYEWADPDEPHATASRRVPVLERNPELFVWKPGVSAWDFLIAITASVNLVLWCDETRNWWLSTADNRTIPSLISITEGNSRDGSDEIDLDDDLTTPTGVVVKYTWTDESGIRQEQYDTAGTPERVYTVELADRAYPGPGTAASILARRQGTGRRQDVSTLTQIGTTPGMTAQVSLPAAPDTTGRVVSVEFDMAAGFMQLGLAGLIDVIPGSVDALTGTVDGLVGTVDSL